MSTNISVDHNGFCFDCPHCNERICDGWPPNGEKIEVCPACGKNLHITATVSVETVERHEQPWTHDIMELGSVVSALREHLDSLQQAHDEHIHHLHNEHRTGTPVRPY